MGLLERHGEGGCTIRTAGRRNARKASMQQMVGEHVEPGSDGLH